MSEYRAVCFDMDGVLVDSEPHWQEIWRDQFFPVVEGDPSIDEVIGRNYREAFAALEESYGLREDRADLERQFENQSERIYAELADGDERVHGLFDAVRERGLPVAIVSSSPEAWIEGVVDRFDLGPLDAVVSADEIDGPGKPEPDVYETAADRIGVDPEDCVVIEDSEHGVRAAAAAGATVIRFEQSATPEPMPEADAVADDPDELRELLLGLLDGETDDQ